MNKKIQLSSGHVTTLSQILEKYLEKDVDQAFVFGSRATGTSRQYSDVDIAVKSSRKLPKATIAKIALDFEESYLPYTVDVVDWSLVSPEFAKVAEATMVRIV